MPERDVDALLIDVFTRLATSWLSDGSPEDIGSDVEKIAIMNAFAELMRDKKSQLPQSILDLYERVYLRDIWENSR